MYYGLLQNIMTFDKCSIAGKVYGDLYDERGEAVDITEVPSFSYLFQGYVNV
jgi:hypothetical protein